MEIYEKIEAKLTGRLNVVFSTELINLQVCFRFKRNLKLLVL